MFPEQLKYFMTLLMLLFYLNAFSVEFNFKYYKAEDGLSSNTVYTALQDSKGFMWFGTENGLNRFDGYTFTVYHHIPRTENSLINNYVYALAEDENEILWIGTERGACSFDLNSKVFAPLTLSTKSGITVTSRIQNLIYDNGQIWIASARQGVFVKAGEELSLHSFEAYKIDRNATIWVNTIYRDKENIIWASVDNTAHQIYKFDPASGGFIPAFPAMPVTSQKELRAYSMLEDTFGTMWFGTWANGLIAVEKKKGIITGKYLNTPGKDRILQIHQITAYDPGTLLIGSNDGLTSFKISPVSGNRRDQHFLEPKLSNRFVYPIYKDAEGGLWIGTYYGGINYASPNRNYFTGYTHIKHENSITGNVVSCFCEDESGNIWIGTEDGGLNELNSRSGMFRSYNLQKNSNGLSFNNVHALCIIENKLWIGTYTGGLNVMDLTTKKIKHYYSDVKSENTLDANNIYAIYHDSADNTWIGTSSGINLYQQDMDHFTPVRNLNEIVMDIIQRGNHIWFATINRGLHRYDLVSGKWNEYLFDAEKEHSLLSNDVISLCVDENQQLWIGTNHGLCRYDAENDSFVDEKVQFPSSYICKIFSENNILWITTLKGLISYNTVTKQFRQFNQSDGLLSDLFTPNSGFKASSGRIYIGTPTGFNAFYPKQLSRNEYSPPIEITQFQLFNKAAIMDEYIIRDKQNKPTLLLAHNNNSFSFEFTALSFFAPEKNKYAFILEGFDKEWHDADKNRSATYTNIPPGNYLFRIKASNNDGIWSDKDYTLAVVIKSPLWWNGWSFSLYLLLIISALIILYHWLRKKERRKNEEEIIKIRNEKEKETYRSQIEFFTNVAHEIRTPLSLIIAPLEQAIESSALLPDSTKENLQIMRSNSERLLTLVNQLLDFSKIEKGGIQIFLSNQNIHSLLQDLYKRFEPLAEQKQIQFEYLYEESGFETETDRENLIIAVSNLLSNACKYATDYIALTFNPHFSTDYYEIAVKDNGPGLPESEILNVFKPFYQVSGLHKSGTGLGLYLVRSIVNALDGKIDISNDAGKGFSISLILPKMGEVAMNSHDEPNFGQRSMRHDVITDKNFTEEISLSATEDGKQTLLIVEDDKEVLSFIRNQLVNEYIVYTAHDGNEGIAVLENHEVDLIVTDLMMPNMDGISFCKTVKSSFIWSHLPVIMLTAKTSVVSKVEAFEIGADAYLDKPFHISYLTARIRNLLETRKLLFEKFTQTPFATLKSIAGNKLDEDFLMKINVIIEKNINNADFSINELASEIGISSSGLFSKIKQLSGVTPNKLILSMRLKKAAELLSEEKFRVNEVCYMVGFNNPSYFAKCFQKQFGKLPKDFTGDLHKEG